MRIWCWHKQPLLGAGCVGDDMVGSVMLNYYRGGSSKTLFYKPLAAVNYRYVARTMMADFCDAAFVGNLQGISFKVLLKFVVLSSSSS